jgi:hypothetical protein
MKRGLYLAPFDELANPRLLAGLARAAESVGWDGLFLWDRIAYPPGERAVADPWVALSAIASVTDTRLGRGNLAQSGAGPTGDSMGRAVPDRAPGPEGLAELAEEVRQARAGSNDPFDLVVEVPPGGDVHSWEAAGATWVLTSIEPQPPEPEIREVIQAGP